MKIELIDKIFNIDNTQELRYFNIELYNGDIHSYYYQYIVEIEVNKDYRALIIKYKEPSNDIMIDYFSSNRIQAIKINKVG